jgi:hypothetical protein
VTPKNRTEIPSDLAAQVLFESDRTCCICRDRSRNIQIHHVDGNPSNNVDGNLAVLCFDCHRDTQIRGGFDRKIDAAQIALYKKDWLIRVAERRDKDHGPRSPEYLCTVAQRVVRFMQMKENSDEHRYTFEADYPQVNTGDLSSDEETNECISAFVTSALQRFREEAIISSSEKNEVITRHPATSWDYLSISHEVTLFSQGLLSIEYRLERYHAMAVHHVTKTHTLNFRLHPSLKLELDDIFDESNDYLEVLSQYCIADLHKQQPMRFHDPSERLAQLKEKQDEWILSGAGPSVSNYGHLVLVKGGIKVIFDEYQVGSYAEGKYEVFIPILVIEPILRESIKALLR